MAQYPIHPAAELFPPMSEEEFDRLVADIREHGQRDPIILHDGAVIDGRNRYLACQKIGIEPRVAEWDGEGSIEAFVVSKNLCRRHMNESQRAMIAARLATLRHGQRIDPRGERPDASIDASAPSAGAQTPRTPSERTAQTEAAKLLNVSRPSVQRARVVLDRGTEEEIKSVEEGAAAVSSVAKAIKAKQAPPAQGGPLNVARIKDYAGRSYPTRPVGDRMAGALDQLDNAIEAIGTLMAEADDDGIEFDWVRRMEAARTALTRTINQGRQRSAA